MHARIQAARENESGFTLIELLIVIVILGVLAGIVVFSVSGIGDRGAVAACKADKKMVEVASEAYYAKTNPPAYAASIPALVTAGLLHSAPPASELITLSATGVVASTFTGCT
jgi:prepilin-type N-terminal cleavage/methylation domain-containing protein